MKCRPYLMLALAVLILPAPAFAKGLPASASASGEGIAVVGSNPYDFESDVAMTGNISIAVNDIGDRQSPLQNIDEVDVKAQFSIATTDYEVTILEPMISHIDGKSPTWFGVGFDKKMYGKTNTYTRQLPLMEPEIVIWGWASVKRDGQIIDARAPAQVTVKKKDPLKGITLLVGAPEQPLKEVGDGYLHLRWPQASSLVLPEKTLKAHYIFGAGALVLLNLWFGWLAITEKVPTPPKRKGRK